jgi:DNA-binding CsgD family transcriptional regulator/N-acetylneuraminic acid mutarotase
MEKELPAITTAELTDREREILKLLATGSSNKEIARDLFISSNTVKVHLRNIFAKIGAASRTEAAMYAVHSGLVKSQATLEPTDGAVTGTAASEAPAPSRRIIRVASVTAILAVLIVVTVIGILLARQQANLGMNTNPPVPTALSRWHILAPSPTVRNGMAVTTFEDQIYVIGGEDYHGVTGMTERYDPATDSWMELSQKPVPVTDANAASILGKIYVPGGRSSSGTVLNTLEIYDPRQATWEKGKKLPVAMSAYAMADYEGRLYLFGGWDGTKYLNSVFIYDPRQDDWEESVRMPTALGFAGAAVVGDKIFIMGGYDGKQALKTNMIFSPSAADSGNPWSQAMPMPNERYSFGIASMADAIYVLGGKGIDNGPLSSLVFLPQASEWQEYEPPPTSIGDFVSLTPLGQYLYALGGLQGIEWKSFNLSYQAIYTILIPVVK